MGEKPSAFILKEPIDYMQQRETFVTFLTELGKDAAVGVEIYDGIVDALSKPGETFMKYDVVHSRVKAFNDKLKWLVRLYVEDDGDNALFRVQAVHQDFHLLFYTEFKSIYGDVEHMRLASIAKRVAESSVDALK